MRYAGLGSRRNRHRVILAQNDLPGSATPQASHMFAPRKSHQHARLLPAGGVVRSQLRRPLQCGARNVFPLHLDQNMGSRKPMGMQSHIAADRPAESKLFVLQAVPSDPDHQPVFGHKATRSARRLFDCFGLGQVTRSGKGRLD
jgi:hypothetical protein